MGSQSFLKNRRANIYFKLCFFFLSVRDGHFYTHINSVFIILTWLDLRSIWLNVACLGTYNVHRTEKKLNL